MLILHQYGPLVFLNARILADSLRNATRVEREIRVVVLDATSSSAIDSSAADKMVSIRDELASAGIQLWVVNPRRRGWDLVKSFLSGKKAAVPRVFDTVQDAVIAFESTVEPEAIPDVTTQKGVAKKKV